MEATNAHGGRENLAPAARPELPHDGSGEIDQLIAVYKKARTAWYEFPAGTDYWDDLREMHTAMEEAFADVVSALRRSLDTAQPHIAATGERPYTRQAERSPRVDSSTAIGGDGSGEILAHVERIAKREAALFRGADPMSFGDGCLSAYCNILAQISSRKHQVGSAPVVAGEASGPNEQERSEKDTPSLSSPDPVAEAKQRVLDWIAPFLAVRKEFEHDLDTLLQAVSSSRETPTENDLGAVSATAVDALPCLVPTPIESSIKALERGIAAITRFQSDEDDEGTEILICDYCYELGDHKDHCPVAILGRLIEDYR